MAEAAIASRLRHPNAVAVLETEELADEVLLVMDYVEGASLAELLRCWPLLPVSVALRIALDAAAGLAELHALCDERGRPLGAVHHDVTPDNLLVGLDGRTRLTDFGSATWSVTGPCQACLSTSGRARAFTAPECLDGYGCDARADVFSLGVLTWELLAARPLFDAAVDGLGVHRPGGLAAPALSSAVPELGDAFDAVLRKALARDPVDRFATVTELADELWAAAAWNGGVAAPYDVGTMVDERVGDALACRRSDLEDQVARTSGVYACA